MLQSIIPSRQFIPIICIFLIAKTSTFLLAGIVAGYIAYISNKNSQPEEKKESKITSSLDYSQEPQYASIHRPFYQENTEIKEACHNSIDIADEKHDENNTAKDNRVSDDIKEIKEDNDPQPSMGFETYIDQSVAIPVFNNFVGKHPLDTSCDTLIESNKDPLSSNASMEFEHLLRFPMCPTTLPRIDTQFNFKMDHHDIKPHTLSDVNWSAIHQELEYEQQRIEEKEEDIDFLPSPASSLTEASDDMIKPYEDVFDDVLLIPPKPSISSQMFKHKFQQTINRIKKKKGDPMPKPSTSMIKGKFNKLFTKKATF